MLKLFIFTFILTLLLVNMFTLILSLSNFQIDSVTLTKFSKHMVALYDTTCTGCKFGHQMASLALVTNLSARSNHLHCHIALDCPISIIS